MLTLCLTSDSLRKKCVGLLCLLILAGVTFLLYLKGLPHSAELQLRAG
jgi:hypothetical protein